MEAGVFGIAGLAGVILPFVISFLKDTTWSTQIKHLVSFGLSAVVAFGITVVDNGVVISNWTEFLANLGVIFTVANVVYTQYFSNTELNKKIENVGVGAGKAV